MENTEENEIKSINDENDQVVLKNKRKKFKESKAHVVYNENIEKDRQARINFLLDKSEIFSHFLDGTGDNLLNSYKNKKSRKRQNSKSLDDSDEVSEIEIETETISTFHFQNSPKCLYLFLF